MNLWKVSQMELSSYYVQYWIPCSEHFPDEPGQYLVSGKGKIWLCEFTKIGNVQGWINSAHNPPVQAWIPLPEPYNKDRDKSVTGKTINHGHWEIAIGYDPRRSFQCSCCSRMAFEVSRYCPSCGARMDEVIEDEC